MLRYAVLVRCCIPWTHAGRAKHQRRSILGHAKPRSPGGV